MRALVSVYDKTGLEAFARGLAELGIGLVASGNTARALGDAGLPHETVESVTGSPEMLGGRVKTLHPRILGGVLANLDEPSHRTDLEVNSIEPFGLVVCNLYPFTASPSIEMIDVGGPTMVRAAAKNHDHVAVVVDPADYGAVLDALRRDGTVDLAMRRHLARKAFAHTAGYDAAIVSWLDERDRRDGTAEAHELPESIHLTLDSPQMLRYGENPHQHGARYRITGGEPGCWDTAVQHGGRELSYLNLFDADAAWRLAHELSTLDGAASVAVIVKHANPCGAAIGPDLSPAYRDALEADPLSAFGGIVALTGTVDEALAEEIVAGPLADVLVARSFDPGALELFAARRRNMRTLSASPPSPPGLALRQIDGAYLVQEPDRFLAPATEWKTVTDVVPTPEQWRDAELAWMVCARTSSNAVVLASQGRIVGVGCGQQSRVDAAGIAVRKAGGRARGGAGASDAFFPFRDGLDAVADSGVGVVVQPGGSLRDDEVIAAANERGIAMVLTGERHFRH